MNLKKRASYIQSNDDLVEYQRFIPFQKFLNNLISEKMRYEINKIGSAYMWCSNEQGLSLDLSFSND